MVRQAKQDPKTDTKGKEKGKRSALSNYREFTFDELYC